jgi:hypothetical protein
MRYSSELSRVSMASNFLLRETMRSLSEPRPGRRFRRR